MTIEKLIENLKERRRNVSANVAESRGVSPNSYGAGYDQGRLDVLEELLAEATHDEQ
jgi:hypothetical protein